MIGILDSGVGGLSVFGEIYRLLPEAQYVYYADNAYCPYGEKPQAFIRERAHYITKLLMDMGCNIVVLACNTATSAAIASLRETYPIGFIGMEPAVKPAVLATKSGVIGVVATAGTLAGARYMESKEKYGKTVKIVEAVGQGWVELVERGVLDGPEVESAVAATLQPLIEAGADNIVLGCTHYPFLFNTIRKILPPAVNVIDSAPAVARRLVSVMITSGLPATGTTLSGIDEAGVASDSSGGSLTERVLSRLAERDRLAAMGEAPACLPPKVSNVTLLASGDDSILLRLANLQ